MSTTKVLPEGDSTAILVEGEDYYSEGAVIVFTARYLLRRGHCCESGCRHCPYGNVIEINSSSDPSAIGPLKAE